MGSEDTVVLVPSEGAADQLRRTLQSLWARDAPDANELPVMVTDPAAMVTELQARVKELPAMVTRGGLYAHLAQRLAEAPPMLDELAREVLFRRAADAAVEQGSAPPFEVRPGLIPEMLALYDALRRQHRTIDDFERLVGGALEAGADIDRGARRLLQQTRFLVSAFRAYETSLAGAGALDEHGLRERLVAEPATRPLRRIVICVPDVRADAAGLWPADFDLLTRLPELASIDLVATERLLATGYLERLFETLPEIEVQAVPDGDEEARIPTLLAPPPTPRVDALHFTSRDREEELSMIAVGVRARAAAEMLERTAVIYQRPLPYLYLARQVFGAHHVSWQAMDALPLAGEPYAAALDLVLTFVASGYTRASGLALLRSPHFRFVGDDQDAAPTPADIALCDAALREADFLGGRERLVEIVDAWERRQMATDTGVDATAGTGTCAGTDPTADARTGATSGARTDARTAATTGGRTGARMRARGSVAVAGTLCALTALRAAAAGLAALEGDALPSMHLTTLEQFLLRHERLPVARREAPSLRPGDERLSAGDDGIAQRHLRARGAIFGTIHGLREAFVRHGERPGPFREVAALVHRWIESHTFNPRVGSEGVHLADVPTAMFGRFSRVALVGLLEGEWPAATSRNVFYPASLLRDLNWPTDAERRTAARATFEDLLYLASDEVMVSACALENDSIVRPSPFVEDLASAGLPVARPGLSVPQQGSAAGARAMTLLTVPAIEASGVARGAGAEPRRDQAAEADEAGMWAALREMRSDAHDRAYHGWTGPVAARAYSVTGIDRYLQCPFKYFAGSVLRLDEELDEQPGLTPLERGRFEHEVFQEFFARWHGAGQGAIDESQLDRARATFAAVVEDVLPRLPHVEQELERTRLLGSAVSAGLGERIFRFEAARPLAIVERLIEFPLEDEYELPAIVSCQRSALSGQLSAVVSADSDGERAPGPERAPLEARGEGVEVGLHSVAKRVRLRGVADRIDLLADGSLRLIDYKTGKGSGVNRTIQLPVYAFCAEQRLANHRGRRWRVGEAGYLAFGRTDPYILAIGAGDDPARVVDPAVAKLRDAVDRIEEGQFWVTPVEPYRCTFCGYATVCRKDYVGDS